LQSRVEGYGWSGTLALSEADRVVVVDSNVGWSKVDRNIERGVAYRIELAEDGPARASLTLRYENLSVPGRDTCESQVRDRGDSYESLKQACYWNLVRAYLGPGAEMVSHDPLPLPRYSVAEAAGIIAIGTDTTEVRQDGAGTYVAGLITVPPADTRTISFVYLLPDPLVERGPGRATYSLVLQHQPGTLGRDMNLEVVLPPGYRYAGGSIVPDAVRNEVVRFRWLLTRDTVVTVDMVRSPEGRVG
jgi:hypothetical protein